MVKLYFDVNVRVLLTANEAVGIGADDAKELLASLIEERLDASTADFSLVVLEQRVTLLDAK